MQFWFRNLAGSYHVMITHNTVNHDIIVRCAISLSLIHI